MSLEQIRENYYRLELDYLKLKEERDALKKRTTELETKATYMADLLGRWCADIEANGSGWDDWDNNYKEARHERNPCSAEITARIEHHLRMKKDGYIPWAEGESQ